MAKSPYITRVRCAHAGCDEWSFYESATRAEKAETEKRLAARPWKCSRHSAPDEVVSRDNHPLTSDLVVSVKDGKSYWTRNGVLLSGVASGPGFRAFAGDFERGSVLRVSATLLPPPLSDGASKRQDGTDPAPPYEPSSSRPSQ